MKLLATLTALFLLSCSPSRHYDEGVNLQPGEISKDKIQAKYIYLDKSMLGWKQYFLTNSGDTIKIPYEKGLIKGRCYYIPKPVKR